MRTTDTIPFVPAGDNLWLMQPSLFDDPDFADRLREATGGRPDLLSMAHEMLAVHGPPDGPLVPSLARPGGAIATYVRQDVLAALSDFFLVLVNAGEFLTLTNELCKILCPGDGEEVMRRLREEGLLMDDRVIPVVAHAARALREPDPGALIRAGRWLEGQDRLVEAARAFVDAGQTAEVLRLLDAHGDALISRGQSALVAEVLSSLPHRTRTRQLMLVDALRVNGSTMAAEQACAVIADAEPVWDAGVAWRMGVSQYFRGDLVEALEAFDRARPEGSSAIDEAFLLVWKASTYARVGDLEMAEKTAREAVDRALASGSERVLAAAYTSLALCLTLAGNTVERDELYDEALRITTANGDVVLQSRILTNQTFQLLHEGRYEQAREAAHRTRQCAIAAGHAHTRWIALCNEGGALTMLGRFDEAIGRLEQALALSRRMGSRRSAAPQIGLGEVYRRRGWMEQARAAYEAAVRLTEDGGNSTQQVVALSGLARVLAATGEHAAAWAAADAAAAHATTKGLALALLAQGWVALNLDTDTDTGTGTDTNANAQASAGELADRAAAAARAGGELDNLADALELRAAAVTDRRKAREALREALALWEACGAEVEAARVACKLGELPGADTDERLAALLGAQTMERAGAAPVPRTGRTVTIKAFGRFEVSVDGHVVPAAQWQSRKARDLLRILVARRGRPVPRLELCELLWPDDDQARTGHRLSVLLSIVRGALDPHRTHPADHYVVADQAGIALDITRAGIDVEEFLSDARHGGRLFERGQPAHARTLLESAAQRYRAEVFEDEPYSGWGDSLREEARAAYMLTLRRLAGLSAGADSVPWLLRLLAIDPYDEDAHRTLIKAFSAAGQHGEARRAFERYRRSMASLGVAVPDQHHSP